MAPRYPRWRLDELYPEERGFIPRQTGRRGPRGEGNAVREGWDKFAKSLGKGLETAGQAAYVQPVETSVAAYKGGWDFVKPDKPISGRKPKETFTPNQPWSTHPANPEFNKLTPGQQRVQRREHALLNKKEQTKINNTDNRTQIPDSKDLLKTVKADDSKLSEYEQKKLFRKGGKKLQTADIKAQEATKDTTSTNLGAKDIAGKLLSSGSGDVSKAYKMIQTGKHLWKMAKGAKAATAATTAAGGAGGAGMAALGPLGIAAAVGLAMLSKKDEKPATPNLRYGGIQEEDYWV